MEEWQRARREIHDRGVDEAYELPDTPGLGVQSRYKRDLQYSHSSHSSDEFCLKIKSLFGLPCWQC